MKSIRIAALIGAVVILSIFSCATVPTEPLASGELRLLTMRVPQKEDIRVNNRFMVSINFEADGEPEIRTACFYFSDDGPYCYKVTDVNYGMPGTIKVQVRCALVGPRTLEGYVYYIKNGKVQATNVIHYQILVNPE